MYKKLRIAIFFLILPFLGGQVSYATDTYIPVRVGISNTNFQTYLFDSIQFDDAKNLTVMDSSSGHNIEIDETAEKISVVSVRDLFSVYVDGVLKAQNLTGPVVIVPKENCFVSISGLKRKGKPAFYRGFIELVRSSKDSSKFSIVNVLSLRNYLRGVVPNEMPVKFGLEALMAQSVAARNYAVAPRVKAYNEFDVCDSVACQVYFGANTEEELSDEAVKRTNGIIATDSTDKPILALYSSTAGGHTESYKNAFSDPVSKVFPADDISYLRGVPDYAEFLQLDKEDYAENFYTTRPESYDDMSPYYRWVKEWSYDELNSVLSKTLVAQSKTGFVLPALYSENDFGNLISITPLERGVSGKVIKLEIKTDKNTFVVQKELVIRRCFQKNGISLPSANFVIQYINSENPCYKFFGGGFGHGVGMSQWGAGKMASLGFSFDEILRHYYKGINLSTIPVTVIPYKKTNDRVFFVNEKKVSAVVKGRYKGVKLYIFINDKIVETKLNDDVNVINISKFVQKGENRISYLLEGSEVEEIKNIEAFLMLKEAENE